MTKSWKVLELPLIELILQTEWNKTVQVMETKYKTEQGQKYPKLHGSVIAHVPTSYLMCKHILVHMWTHSS